MPFIPWLITRIFWIWLILTLCSGPSDHKPQTRREAIARPPGHGDHTPPPTASSEIASESTRIQLPDRNTSSQPTQTEEIHISIIPKALGRTLVAAAAAQQI